MSARCHWKVYWDATLSAAAGAQADESAKQLARRADAARSDLAFVTGLTRYDPADVERLRATQPLGERVELARVGEDGRPVGERCSQRPR